MSQGYEASGAAAEHPLDTPDITISVRETFGIDIDMEVPAFSQGSEHVPAIDPTYRFDRDTTMA
ncbi:MAG: cobaltochelatase subunit CobS, partial [Thalassospira sp.]|nr:cobaltochelatase subunit CobS [Thalassospira sp.]